jgi:hypothetical protein
MGWGFKKSKDSNRKKGSKASENKEKPAGNFHVQTVDNTSDGNTEKSQSERLQQGKKNGAVIISPAAYTPRNNETTPKKRHQRKTPSSDKLPGSTSKEKVNDVAKKPFRISERAISSGNTDTSSKRHRRTKTRQKKSDNKSVRHINSEKEGKKAKKKSVANKKPAKHSGKRSAEHVSDRVKRDSSANKQSNRKKKWPKNDRTTEMPTMTVENTEDQKPKSVTPGKEAPPVVSNSTTGNEGPAINKPTDQKISKEVNIDDDCVTELRTCSLLRSPVPNKRHMSPLHKNKNMQIN